MWYFSPCARRWRKPCYHRTWLITPGWLMRHAMDWMRSRAAGSQFPWMDVTMTGWERTLSECILVAVPFSEQLLRMCVFVWMFTGKKQNKKSISPHNALLRLGRCLWPMVTHNAFLCVYVCVIIPAWFEWRTVPALYFTLGVRHVTLKMLNANQSSKM